MSKFIHGVPPLNHLENLKSNMKTKQKRLNEIQKEINLNNNNVKEWIQESYPDDYCKQLEKKIKKLEDRLENNHLFTTKYLQSFNFNVSCVIDIGVFQGTPRLYNAFPNTFFVLVDPHKQGQNLLKDKPNKYQFFNVALGSSPGTIIMNQMGAKSTLLTRTKLTASKIQKTYEVKVITLDDLIQHLDTATRKNIGIKIDTEGFELEILKGLNKYQDNVQFLITETNVRKRFTTNYRFSELISQVSNLGLEFYNFLNPKGRAPRYYDCLFLRKESRFFN